MTGSGAHSPGPTLHWSVRVAVPRGLRSDWPQAGSCHCHNREMRGSCRAAGAISPAPAGRVCQAAQSEKRFAVFSTECQALPLRAALQGRPRRMECGFSWKTGREVWNSESERWCRCFHLAEGETEVLCC